MECFAEVEALDHLDSAAFKFNHNLLGHPALSLENLAQVLPALPAGHVVYSKNLLSVSDDFEGTFKEPPADRSLEQTLDTIRTSNSYIMVNRPEVNSSFAPVYLELLNDVELLLRRLGMGKHAIDPKLFLFIASPNSITPFHIDRYSTFLLQFRGSKQVSVFPQWSEHAVSSAHREAYMAYANTQLPWSADIDSLGTCFDFAPGEAIHIPFVAGHHVRNGGDDVSISMSIIFNSEQSMAWRNALRFNYSARRVLAPLGLTPHPVGQSPLRDKIKAKSWRAFTRLRGH